jgi:hypothetical protein
MKTILEFNLPDDSEELINAQNANKYLGVITDFSDYLRNEFKYKTKKERDSAEKMKDKWFEIISSYDEGIL